MSGGPASAQEDGLALFPVPGNSIGSHDFRRDGPAGGMGSYLGGPGTFLQYKTLTTTCTNAPFFNDSSTGRPRQYCSEWAEYEVFANSFALGNVTCAAVSDSGRYCKDWVSVKAVTTFDTSDGSGSATAVCPANWGSLGCSVLSMATDRFAKVKSCSCRTEAENGNFCTFWQCQVINDDGNGGLAYIDYTCIASYKNSSATAKGNSLSSYANLTADLVGKLRFSALPQNVYDTRDPNHTICAGWVGRKESSAIVEQYYCTCDNAGAGGDVCAHWVCRHVWWSWALGYWTHLLTACFYSAFAFVCITPVMGVMRSDEGNLALKADRRAVSCATWYSALMVLYTAIYAIWHSVQESKEVTGLGDAAPARYPGALFGVMFGGLVTFAVVAMAAVCVMGSCRSAAGRSTRRGMCCVCGAPRNSPECTCGRIPIGATFFIAAETVLMTTFAAGWLGLCVGAGTLGLAALLAASVAVLRLRPDSEGDKATRSATTQLSTPSAASVPSNRTPVPAATPPRAGDVERGGTTAPDSVPLPLRPLPPAASTPSNAEPASAAAAPPSRGRTTPAARAAMTAAVPAAAAAAPPPAASQLGDAQLALFNRMLNEGAHKCPVCFGSVDSTNYAITSCGHLMCRPCLAKLPGPRPLCPLCRTETSV